VALGLGQGDDQHRREQGAQRQGRRRGVEQSPLFKYSDPTVTIAPTITTYIATDVSADTRGIIRTSKRPPASNRTSARGRREAEQVRVEDVFE
jgi:hypothetical protein